MFAICLGHFTGCPIGPVGPPGAPEKDLYQYPSVKFYSSSGQKEVGFAILKNGDTAPIIWIMSIPIDIRKDDYDQIIQILGPPDEQEYNKLTYSDRESRHVQVIFYFKDKSVDYVYLDPVAGISKTIDSEVLMLPCTRDELLRVFGKPDQLILSR